MNKHLMKKKEQLGMNPSTASQRLVKDILWSLIVKTGQDNCHRCSKKMSRDNFSIEHIEDWLDSEDPVGLYFDLTNITFSHLKCNVGASRGARGKSTTTCGTLSQYSYGCRCDDCKAAKSQHTKSRYSKEARRERYKTTGN